MIYFRYIESIHIFFFTSTGFGTRNRIAGLPLNFTALLIQNPLMVIQCFVTDDDVLLNSPSINHFSECVGFSAFTAEFSSATKYSLFLPAYILSKVLLCCWVFSIRNC